MVIGADPLRHALGHSLSLRFCDIKVLDIGHCVRQCVETLIWSTSGLALDLSLKTNPRRDLIVLSQLTFPRLTTLIMTGGIGTTFKLNVALKSTLSSLTALYLDAAVDAVEICVALPSLTVLCCDVVHCDKLQLIPEHRFFGMISVSFLYGVTDAVLHRIFWCFPNLKRIGLEFDEMTPSLSTVLMQKQTPLDRLQMAWNPQSFWGQNKRRGAVDVEHWLRPLCNVRNIILDRDYFFDESGLDAAVLIRQLLPMVNVTVARGACNDDLIEFMKYTGCS